MQSVAAFFASIITFVSGLFGSSSLLASNSPVNVRMTQPAAASAAAQTDIAGDPFNDTGAASSVAAATAPTPALAPPPTQTVINQPVIERIIERIVPQGGMISADTLSAILADFEQSIGSRIAAINPPKAAISEQVAAGGNAARYYFVPASQRIDQLTNTAINAPTISGGSIANASVSGTLSGTFSGTVSMSNASSTSFTNSGSTWLTGLTSALLGTDSTGKVVATTSIGTNLLTGILGIANGGTATSTQVTNGVNFFDGNRITSGTALTFTGTNLGIGTTSPFWALTAAASTGPQLALTDTTSSNNAWTMRSISNSFYLATSTATATSTTAAFSINGTTGAATFGSPATTIFSGDLQTAALNVTTGTSTFANGLIINAGCIYINGACLNTGGLTNYWTLSGSALSNNSGTYLGIGTTTPKFGLLTLGTSTAPQLMLTDNTAGNNIWTMRSISNSFYLATSTATATSTSAALTVDPNGKVSLANTLAINGNIGIGSTAPFARLSVTGADQSTSTKGVIITDSLANELLTVFNSGLVKLQNLLATASSTIGNGTQAGGLTINGGATTTSYLVVQGSSTSTFTGGVQASALNVTSASATSTFANGISLNSGCFNFGSGTCLGPNAGVTLTQVIASSSPGSNTSFTVPTNTAYIIVRVWGAGGGGSGGGNSTATSGSTGSTSCFGINSTSSTCTGTNVVNATGGGGGLTSSAGGSGGVGSGGDINLTGEAGGGSAANGVATTFTATGMSGGSAPLGGGGATDGFNAGGGTGAAFGGGGAGGAVYQGPNLNYFNGSGGGGGGYTEKTITNPTGTYYYTIGSGGAGGTAGASGYAGGAGGAGGITIYVYTTSQLTSSGAGVTLTRVISQTSGTNVTYTPPSNISYIEVEVWGAGGGGGGGGNGSAGGAGNTSCFGVNSTSSACTGTNIVSATGGGGGTGTGSSPGTGGAGVGGDINLTGSSGGGSNGVVASASGAFLTGTQGGSAPLGGGGGTSNYGMAGTVGAAFGGGGGGGAIYGTAGSYTNGGGGGGGGYAKKVITGPSGTYYYTVGSGGSVGAAGSPPSGTSYAGGAGGAGGIVIKEYTTGAATAGSVGAGTQGQFAFYNAAGNNLTATSTLFINTSSGLIGVGTTTPWAALSLTTPSQQNGSTALFSVASTTGAHLFDILGNGSVGIGTTTPINNSNFTTLNIHGTNGGVIELTSAASSTPGNLGSRIYSDSGDNSFNAGNWLNGPTYLWSNGQKRLTITSAGNVGIGTTTTVTKDGAGTYLFIDRSAVSQYAIATYINNTGSAAIVAFQNPNGTVGSIQTAGSATSYNTSSDGRIKDGIATTTLGLNELMRLPVREFSFKSDLTHATTTGFIAQELRAIFPWAVATNGDNGIDPLGTSTPWSIDYGRVTPLIVKAIQDIANIAGIFRDNLIAWLGNASNGIGKLFAREICLTDDNGTTCYTRSQLNVVLAGTASTASGASAPGTISATVPVIELNGNASSTIQVGDTYSDLGARVVAPESDLNLGIVILLDGATTTQVSIDTTQPGEHTILYTVTSPATSLTGRTLRTVIVSPAEETNPFDTPPANDNASSTPAVDAAA